MSACCWCEGLVQQATVFGEDLHLIRRIEAKVGESAFTLHDRVVNHGFYQTPHMFLYHINLGYPVLDRGSRYLAPINQTIWASHADNMKGQGVGYLFQPEPKHGFHEQVYEHAMVADAQGQIPIALVNPDFDGGRGLGFMVEVNRKRVPLYVPVAELSGGPIRHRYRAKLESRAWRTVRAGARRADLA